MVKIRPPTGSRGAALVEAALILPVITLLTLGAVDTGLHLSAAATTTGATRNGARTAAIELELS